MNLIFSAVVVVILLILYKFTQVLQSLPKYVNLTLVVLLLTFTLYNFTVANNLYNTSGSLETVLLNLVLGILLFVISLKVMDINKEE